MQHPPLGRRPEVCVTPTTPQGHSPPGLHPMPLGSKQNELTPKHHRAGPKVCSAGRQGLGAPQAPLGSLLHTLLPLEEHLGLEASPPPKHKGKPHMHNLHTGTRVTAWRIKPTAMPEPHMRASHCPGCPTVTRSLITCGGSLPSAWPIPAHRGHWDSKPSDGKGSF